jgi:hypothetical protein
MTQEEKELLVKDLCARLPYGVIVHADEINIVGELIDINIPYNIASIRIDVQSGKYTPAPISDVKPYLRPITSMTEEEKQDYNSKYEGKDFTWELYYGSTDWLLEHHFDFRGLIEKGLAIEAPEGMYIYEN